MSEKLAFSGFYSVSSGMAVVAGSPTGAVGSVGVSIDSTPFGLSRYKYSV
jgi:hypothetical protein